MQNANIRLCRGDRWNPGARARRVAVRFPLRFPDSDCTALAGPPRMNTPLTSLLILVRLFLIVWIHARMSP